MSVLPDYVTLVEQLLKDNENCYLVGGAVRDFVLGRKIQDFDFATDTDPRKLARKVADRLGGAFYVMDEQRFTSRVILKQTMNLPVVMDFSALQGSLENDLKERDFTINAMAIDLQSQELIIDPLKGGRDLQEKWLRLCTPSSLLNDPVRVIRAMRYASDLGLRIEPQTSRLINQGVKKLHQVSAERKRDELFKILDNPKSFPAILLLERFGILTSLGCSSERDRMGQLRTYEIFQNILVFSPRKTGTDHLIAASLLSAITSSRKKLSSFMAERNTNGHSRYQLDKFALLASRQVTVEDRGNELLQIFSKGEMNFLQQFFTFEKLVEKLLKTKGEISNRDAYRFFYKVGESGIDIVFLGLADIASKPVIEVKQDDWLQAVKMAARLIDIWFEYPEISRPLPLVNGNEIMSHLRIEAGPMVGQLLTALKEEQAAGNISNYQTALTWLKQKYEQIK